MGMFAENEDIIVMLRQLGVDYAQGYGVAMPAKIMRGPLDRIIAGES